MKSVRRLSSFVSRGSSNLLSFQSASKPSLIISGAQGQYYQIPRLGASWLVQHVNFATLSTKDEERRKAAITSKTKQQIFEESQAASLTPAARKYLRKVYSTLTASIGLVGVSSGVAIATGISRSISPWVPGLGGLALVLAISFTPAKYDSSPIRRYDPSRPSRIRLCYSLVVTLGRIGCVQCLCFL
eukprot:TRINITY_DN423_c0_g1_i1.p1 TRINITY_DN423_c0_g1~~TRINITY_DN423_c0_g1_i1.p1  ORF type:complete len:187 (+),score=0.93 TRINITY_DN423_c0_g1_i1:1-561(+)